MMVDKFEITYQCDCGFICIKYTSHRNKIIPFIECRDCGKCIQFKTIIETEKK